MAEREGPIIPKGAAPAKRQVDGRKLLLWLGGAAVVAVAALAVIRFVDFGGSTPQAAPAPQTLPPDPVTATTVAPTTTTTAPPVVEAVDSDEHAAETGSTGSSPQPEPEPVVVAVEGRADEMAPPPPADARFLTIRDAGDFAGIVALQCADYTAQLRWQVLPPYRDGEGDDGRVRTPAPIGGDGQLRVEMETFVPAPVDAESNQDAASDEPGDAGSGGADDTGEGEAAESAAAMARGSALVFEASSISGRGTDRDGEGEAAGVLRHRCLSASTEQFAEWKLTVAGHPEVAWELTFRPVGWGGDADDANAAGTGHSSTGEPGDGAPADTGESSVGDIVSGVVGSILGQDDAASTEP